MGITHIAFNFSPWGEGCDGVDNNNINRARAHNHVANLESLLSGIWLRDQQIFGVNPKVFSIYRIKRVLCIDKGAGPPRLLGFGDHLQGECGFT